jgi:sugar phosphate isomerase/epimerase
MPQLLTRRGLLLGSAGVLAMAKGGADRLGINLHLETQERAARDVLARARQAGFRRAQVYFDWVKADASFLRALPGWIQAEDLRTDVLGAYVNCAAPDTLIMETRAQDLDRAIELAPSLGVKRLTAWTGGYGSGLFVADERNFTPAAADAIIRTLETRYQRLEERGLQLALESYVTLACPDAPSLRRLLDRTPPCVQAVFDPPNLTPIRRYRERDTVLREMAKILQGRVGVVHCKDFRLAEDGRSYQLPGPLDGVMNYPLFLDCIKPFPSDVPLVAEHIAPEQYASYYARLAPLFASRLE